MLTHEETRHLRGKVNQWIEEYNSQIRELMQKRKKLMDDNMALFADVQPGQKAYTSEGEYLGVVEKLYRHHATGDYYDTIMNVHYQFDNGDNTSRRMIFSVYTEEESKRMKLEHARRYVSMHGTEGA